jgi:hypothetical protein
MLESLVQSWARDAGVETKAAAWMKELIKNDIGSLLALEIVAEGPAWNDFLGMLTPVLRSFVVRWRKDRFPQRKLIFDCCFFLNDANQRKNSSIRRRKEELEI